MSSLAQSTHLLLPFFLLPGIATIIPFLTKPFFSFSRVHTSVALHSKVCLLALRFLLSLSRIRCLSCHPQCPSHHFQLCYLHFFHLSFRHCHRFHSIRHGWTNNSLVHFTLTLADNFLPHRTPDAFLQLIHPAWILLLPFFSHLPLLLTVVEVFRSLYLFF